jgi:hypothetical protein
MYTIVAGYLRILDNDYFAAYGHPYYTNVTNFDFVKNIKYGTRLATPISNTGYLYLEQTIADYYLCIIDIVVYDLSSNIIALDSSDIVIGSPITTPILDNDNSTYYMNTISQSGKTMRLALGSNDVSRIKLINNINVFRFNWRNVIMRLVTPTFNISTIIPYAQDMFDFYFNGTTLTNVKTNNHQNATIYYMPDLRSTFKFAYFLNYPENYRNASSGKIFRYANGIHFNLTDIETFAYNGFGSLYNIRMKELLALPATGTPITKAPSLATPYWMFYLV